MAGFIMRQHTWKGQNFYDIDTDSVSGRERIEQNYRWRKTVINDEEVPSPLPSQEEMIAYLNEVNSDNSSSQYSAIKRSACLERAKIILKKVADMLIDTGTGWELDPLKHQDAQKGTDDFKSITTSEGYDIGVCLYLRSVEDVDGATKVNEKLLLGYTYTGIQVKSQHTYESSSGSNSYYVTGLFSSMIPADTNAVFGDVFDAEGYIPACATKIHSANVSASGTIAWDNSNNTAYHAQVVTNGHIISFRVYVGQSRGSWWFVGPLIGTLAHGTMDVTPQAKLMDMGFTETTDESSTSYSYSNGDSVSSSDTDQSYWSNEISSSKSSYGSRRQVHMFDAAGILLEGKAGKEIFWSGSISQCASCISDSSVVGFNRWVAMYVGVMSQEPSSPGNYIVRGDGMKGYMDTNFLRYVRRGYYTFGQTFDDGNFVYIGRGIAMGWDPSNGSLNAN